MTYFNKYVYRWNRNFFLKSILYFLQYNFELCQMCLKNTHFTLMWQIIFTSKIYNVFILYMIVIIYYTNWILQGNCLSHKINFLPRCGLSGLINMHHDRSDSCPGYLSTHKTNLVCLKTWNDKACFSGCTFEILFWQGFSTQLIYSKASFRIELSFFHSHAMKHNNISTSANVHLLKWRKGVKLENLFFCQKNIPAKIFVLNI